MNFASIEFVLFCVLAVSLVHWSSAGRGQIAAIVVLNLVFLASFVTGFADIAPLAAFAAIGYIAILVSTRVGPKALLGLIAFVVVLFAWLKSYTIVAFLPKVGTVYLTLGLSYMLFRILHLMVDTNQGVLPPPSPLSYTAYLLFFLSFVSGPIQRYEDFEGQMSERAFPRGVAQLSRIFNWILAGFFVLGIATRWTSDLSTHLQDRFLGALDTGSPDVGTVALGSLAATAFGVHLYVGFEGYMRLMIGIGALCGIRLPENFDRPYLSHDMLDFWNRWHITLSQWFKFYLFNPMLKAMAGRWGSPASTPYLGAAAYFLTFLAMGIWHGTTSIFVVYGVLLGIGISANKLTQIQLTRRLGKVRYKELQGRLWYAHLCRGLCLAWFIVCISCLWLPPGKVHLLRGLRGLELASGAFLMLTGWIFVVSLSMTALARRMEPRLASVRRRASAFSIPLWASPVGIAVKSFALIQIVVVFGGRVPDLVYKGF
jgi:D-alanyl-lipoteichoic acid acyltransferase DltB (MBOAT superfamily)